MKKIVLPLVFVICLFGTSFAQDVPVKEIQRASAEQIKIDKATLPAGPKQQVQQTSTPPNPNAPEIKFDAEVIDYGTIEYNGDGKREFTFTNTGKEPLIITRAKGSCGCTVPTWPKEPIMPGAKGTIKVKYATNRPGKFTKTVSISSNAKTATKRLTIKGTVKPKPVEATDQTVPVKKVIEGATPVEPNK